MSSRKLAAIILVLGVMLAGCITQGQATAQGTNASLQVVASFYPMYDFARNVGGGRVQATTLIPAGVEPHNFEATPSEIARLSQADIFILNGAGMEKWAPNLLSGIDNDRLAVVDASADITRIKSQDADEAGDDPHTWLSPANAKKQVEAIRDAFAKADPEGKGHYYANAAAYEAKLDALDSKLRTELSTCKKRDILITHATLAYFCQDYGCNQIPIEGVSEEGEPTPAELARIVDQARERNVTAVYFESLISPKSAQTLASEIGGKVLAFNTVHGVTAEEEAAGADYISLMEGNLESIKKGLDCD